jgi:predicted AAA+ superfamily ATPase
MTMINRDYYLNKLISKKQNGMVKIITGIRRCGKSVLLFDLFYEHLIKDGVKEDHIIKIKLDERTQVALRNPNTLCDYVAGIVRGKTEPYFILIDEIQLLERIGVEGTSSQIGIYEVLNELNGYKNTDVYVTGSNSKMLSSDIATEFRGRGDQLRIHPLSFREFYDAYSGDKRDAFHEFAVFGGMPYLFSLKNDAEKSAYLKELVDKVYLSDIVERNSLKKDTVVLGELLDVVASSTGSLTSPAKITNTFKTVYGGRGSLNTVNHYLDCFKDAFLVSEAKRYDIRGRSYIDSPKKLYFEDLGLRNARLGFREQDFPHIMENIVYNELIRRGYNVDVGVIDHSFRDESGKKQKRRLEIDFICNLFDNRIYIQSAYMIQDEEKRDQETRGFKMINDSFRKIVVTRDTFHPWKDENGFLYVGIESFLLNEEFMK